MMVNSFCRYIRRISIPPEVLRAINKPNFHGAIGIPSASRFDLSAIVNMDETPLPFEFLEGITYALKGEKTVTARTERNGWGKRQTSLVLFIFADGIARIKPMIIFHGEERPGRAEALLYHDGVQVTFNDTAYNNASVFMKQIQEDLLPTLHPFVTSVDGDMIFDEEGNAVQNKRDSLFVMDHASFHKTDEIKQVLRENHVSTAIIPPGTTGLLQPLDVSVNKVLKGNILKIICERLTDQDKMVQWTTQRKRVFLTKVVAEAWKRVHEKPDLIRRSFTSTGIAVNPNGSDDWKISIKDHPQVDFEGWSNQVDPEDLYQRVRRREVQEEEEGEEEYFMELEENWERIFFSYVERSGEKLKEICRKREISGFSNRRKDELVAKLARIDMERAGIDIPDTFGKWEEDRFEEGNMARAAARERAMKKGQQAS